MPVSVASIKDTAWRVFRGPCIVILAPIVSESSFPTTRGPEDSFRIWLISTGKQTK